MKRDFIELARYSDERRVTYLDGILVCYASFWYLLCLRIIRNGVASVEFRNLESATPFGYDGNICVNFNLIYLTYMKISSTNWWSNYPTKRQTVLEKWKKSVHKKEEGTQARDQLHKILFNQKILDIVE